jgi:maltooligosyltrehalose trehalohydrolase
LRRNCRALRSRESFYYFQQSLKGNQVVAYHRHAPATANEEEAFAMVLLNFGDATGAIQLPFPQKGTWQEMLDDDVREKPLTADVTVQGAFQQITVPSHYGYVYVLKP